MAEANLVEIHNNIPSQKRRWPSVAVAILFFVLAGVALGEWLGWPFLAEPIQRTLSEKLDRRVSFAGATDQSTPHPASFRIRFIGGVHVETSHLEIAAPAWSKVPHLLSADDVVLDLSYGDLWRARGGEPLRIDRLQAAALDGNLERQADGRAGWHFGPTPSPIPTFGHLQVTKGTLNYRDVPLTIDVVAHLSLANGASVVTTGPAPTGTPGNTALAGSEPENLLQADARGHYRGLPIKIEMVSSGVLPWAADGALATPVPLRLNATVGGASLVFNGTAVDVLHLTRFTGRYSLKGPSLAAVGDMLGVTLPTTGAFHTEGVVVRQKDTWRVVVDDATVGASRLTGAFTYEAGRSIPSLVGRLGGSRLLLTDLGPVVGSTSATTSATTEATTAKVATTAAPTEATKTKITNAATKSLPRSTKGKGMVLPDRPFDLAALRAMDANVLIDIAEVDLNTKILEPLRPLHAHLQLVGGVLTLSDIEARTGQGRLNGGWSLDGRGSQALWNADLRWDGVRLEHWIHQARAGNAPPYITGRLSGKTSIKGQGRSTAEILASLKGQFRTDLQEGTVSHLVIEAGGLDIAQGLGVLFKGDDALPVSCAAADLAIDGGVFRPRVMVMDTSDSAVWVDGSLSLANEAIDLRVVVVPKDFSPLTLRTPLLVRGTFANPEISVEKGPLGRKLASAFVLGLLNPIAALIPLIDTGDAAAANKGAAPCAGLVAGLVQHSKAKLAVIPPASKR